jgi:hypothetical protein
MYKKALETGISLHRGPGTIGGTWRRACFTRDFRRKMSF